MKNWLVLSPLALCFMAWPLAATAQESLETESEKLSYAIGLDIGQSLKDLDTELDLKVLMQGVEHVLQGQEPLLTTEELNAIKQAFFQQRQAAQQAAQQAAAEKNQAEGQAFLAENKTKEGVQTTESGLQYKVLEQGDGPKPKATDTVSVHYQGTLVDGTVFDSSYQRGQPTSFPLNRVIPGWSEGLQLMPVGSKYQFVIPAELAYGPNGAGGTIGPNATLIFEVELLNIVE